MDREYSTHDKKKGWRESRKELGRPRRRWVDNIKMCLRDIGLGDMD
jgi:hypothetical protein